MRHHQTPPDKSGVHRATHSLTTAHKLSPQGGTLPSGACEMLRSPQEGPANRPYSAYKNFGPGSHKGGSSTLHFVSQTRFFYERFLRKISRPSIQDRGLYGTRPGVRESGAENPTGRDEAGAGGQAGCFSPSLSEAVAEDGKSKG